MLHQELLVLLALLFFIFLLVMVGKKVKVSAPIALVTGGLLISLVPGMPTIIIDPELIFLIFLPPLLYAAAWNTSWNDFWKWRRAISLLGFGLVIFNALIVAFVSVMLIPGFNLALGLLLGGIISPPDAVAATSVLKEVKIPKRLVSILEGESLINDASSLVIVRFALMAVLTGKFVFAAAAGSFIMVTVMGILIGILIAVILFYVHRILPTSADIDTALTLMAPYIMYLTAEELHFSGVMAVVSGGLFLSYRSHLFLTHRSRVQGAGTWSTIVFLLNGLVFILIGLQLPSIVSGMKNYSLVQAITYGIIISLLCMAIRMCWIYPATYLPRFLFKSIREKEPVPDKKAVFLIGWAGMRGVVTMAAALNIPLLMPGGSSFPHRNLILFISFIVILFSLLLQGITLPWMARTFDLKSPPGEIPDEEQESAVLLRLKSVTLANLQDEFADEIKNNELVSHYKSVLEKDIDLTIDRLTSSEMDEMERQKFETYKKIRFALFDIQRNELAKLRSEKIYDEDEIRKQQANIDLEEMRLKRL